MKSLLFLSIFIPFFSNSQPNYAFSNISKSLLENADAVVRNYDFTFYVENIGEAKSVEHRAVTLLNERAFQQFGEPYFYYYPFEKIENIEASVFDAAGTLVRNLKKKDIEDFKVAQYFVNDVRYKILKLPGRNFPYTIEYTVSKKHIGLMFYPNFEPQESPSVAVEHASFELKMPPGLAARIREINLPTACKKSESRWEFENIKAFRPEPFMPVGDLPLPKVLVAPTDFEFAGVRGDMRSWNGYGKFLEKLNQNRQELPPETIEKLKKLVADCPDDACKIQRIYENLQATTRYFFVGLGIGGWQPAPASEVDEFKYGDCKGLSNYMVSMLRAVEVEAFYAIIQAGETAAAAQFPDFPNPHFNHIIVCAPVKNDTFWLECTSQSESCGFLGTFTDNRPALLICPGGGKLLHTPKYDETQNTVFRETEISLAPDGSATLKSKGIFQGISQNVVSELAELSPEFQQKYFYKILNVNDFEIKTLSFKRIKKRLPSVEQNLELALPRLATVSGKRLFLPVNLLSEKLEIPVVDTVRRFSIQPDSRGLTENDVVKISVPAGFQLENQLEPTAVDSDFGQFEISVKFENGQVEIHRKLILNSKIFPKERFADWLSFLKIVSKWDKTKLVLVKKT